jgi:IS5 family transposase
VAIPVSGKLSAGRRAVEHTPAFQQGYRFRAGIEGRIASLRWDCGWWRLGLGVMASNQRQIARASEKEARPKGGEEIPEEKPGHSSF